MAEYELVIEEAQREDSVSLAQLLETVTLESDFLAQDDRSSVLNGEQLASYIDSRCIDCPVNHCSHKKLTNTIAPIRFSNRNENITDVTGLRVLIRSNITNTNNLMTQFFD